MTEVPKHKPADADRATTEVPKYKQTEAERAALDRQAQRQKEQPAAPRFNVVADYRGFRIEQNHPDLVVAHSLLKDALGTTDDDFCHGLLGQLCELAQIDDSSDTISEADFNFLISTIKTMKSKGEHHAMLLAQMGGIHMAQMKMMKNFTRIQRDFLLIDRDWTDKNPHLIDRRATLIKNLSLLLDSTERSVNRLARTFCMQLETSDRHRRSGEPSMTVQQLTVAQGGQAIVGNVTHATPQTAPNNPTAGPQALTDQQHSVMPVIGETDRVAIPLVAGNNND